MSLLIVGGLLIIGVLAIVGVVMLSISEQRGDAANKMALASSPHTTEVPTSAKLTVPLEQRTEAPMSVKPSVPLEEKKALVPSEEEQLRATLNGQFHELSHEIHNLHDQAWQLEQRLGILTNMLDRIERSRNGHTNIEEDSNSNIPLDNTLV